VRGFVPMTFYEIIITGFRKNRRRDGDGGRNRKLGESEGPDEFSEKFNSPIISGPLSGYCDTRTEIRWPATSPRTARILKPAASASSDSR
jgi:hypothetical protein